MAIVSPLSEQHSKDVGAILLEVAVIYLDVEGKSRIKLSNQGSRRNLENIDMKLKRK